MNTARNFAQMLKQVLAKKRRWAILPGKLEHWWPHLPDASVHHLISDPPYSLKVHSLRRQTPTLATGLHVGKEQLAFSHLSDSLRDFVAFQAWRTVKRWSVVFSDFESVHRWQGDFQAWGVEHIRVGVWVKTNPQPQLSGDRPGSGAEALQISHPPGRKKWNGGGHAAVWRHPTVRKTEGKLCQAQKPLSLMKDLISAFTMPGDVVLDPFCGSATTGVAALELGRRFIGFEGRAGLARKASLRMAIADAVQSQLGMVTRRRMVERQR